MFERGTRVGDHTVCAQDGEGPAVLLLNGCGISSLSWRQFADLLPGRRLVAVDRPGFGGPWRRWPTLSDEADVLGSVADAEGGLVVVAHSMASFHAEALARVRPGHVRGIVLVDPSLEPSPWWSRVRVRWLAAPLRAVLSIGVVRRLGVKAVRLGMAAQTRHPDLLGTPDWSAIHGQRDALLAAATEWLSYPRQAADLNEGRTVPLDVPVIVLDAPPGMNRHQLVHLTSGFSSVQVWRVPDSLHLMMLDRPDEIVRAVEALA